MSEGPKAGWVGMAGLLQDFFCQRGLFSPAHASWHFSTKGHKVTSVEHLNILVRLWGIIIPNVQLDKQRKLAALTWITQGAGLGREMGHSLLQPEWELWLGLPGKIPSYQARTLSVPPSSAWVHEAFCYCQGVWAESSCVMKSKEGKIFPKYPVFNLHLIGRQR